MKIVTGNFSVRRLLLTLVVIGWSALLLSCYSNRWEQYDETMKSQIGSKNKDYYIVQWGPPSKRARLDSGGEVLTWEGHGFIQGQYSGHSTGWYKTLVFSPDGLLQSHKWDYWGMPPVAPPWVSGP
jgi:hypothetical protein